ncbi:MAG: anti-sigma regulatory factor [Myxococcales bacterium]|nr:anti-sigma regulatory factor [Myxococcales bacterium]
MEVEFCPSWGFIDDARRFVEAFCCHSRVPAERATQIAMAAHELLQNAVKYSEDGRAGVKLRIDPPKDWVDLVVENRCTASAAKQLKVAASRLTKAADPLQVYVELMHETARREDGSGLGLARIQYEAQLELEFAVRGRAVSVRASGPLALREQPARKRA